MFCLSEAGALVEAPYSPCKLAFIFEDDEIRNPMISPCGRFAVDPTIYGFVLAAVGPNDRVLVLELSDGQSLWLTDKTMKSPPNPQRPEDAVLSLIGRNGARLAHTTIGEVIMDDAQDLPDAICVDIPGQSTNYQLEW